MDTAYEVWRDDLESLTDAQFERKYGQGKQAMWQSVERENQRYMEILRRSLPVDRDGFPVQLAPSGASDDDLRHGGNRAAVR